MDNPERKKEFKPAVMYFPIPDVKVETFEQDNITTTRQYPVMVPKSERDDFMIQVRASQINEIRETFEGIKDEKFPTSEIILFLTSALIGSTISALFSDLKITDTWGKINFILFPIASKLRLPFRFIGIGEGIDDLKPFVAEEFVQALFAAE